LVSLRTSLADLTFLTVRLSLSATVLTDDTEVASDTFTLSIPTSGGDTDVVFDLSSALSSLFQYVSVSPCFAKVMSAGTQGFVRYSFKAWDEYLDEDNAIVSTEDNAISANQMLFALPGSLSDVQRLLWDNEGRSLDAGNMIFSSKPDGEVIPLGFPLLLPVHPYIKPTQVGPTSLSVSVTQGGKSSSVVLTTSARQAQWVPISFSQAGAATVSVPDADNVSLTVLPSHPYAAYFEFLNRYGCLESIVCYGSPSLSVTQEAERLSRVQDRSFRPSSRYMKRISSQEQTLSLSTGPLSVEWAKWFTDEFFCATQVWMYEKSLDCMVPVVIELEDDAVIYSNEEPGVVDISFKAVSAYSGFATGRHM
jgi:hypothetical protein